MSDTTDQDRGTVVALSREAIDSQTIEITLSRPMTNGEFINLWLSLKHFWPMAQPPAGWEPADKSNPDDWAEVGPAGRLHLVHRGEEKR
jgi:hypothetical protein